MTGSNPSETDNERFALTLRAVYWFVMKNQRPPLDEHAALFSLNNTSQPSSPQRRESVSLYVTEGQEVEQDSKPRFTSVGWGIGPLFSHTFDIKDGGSTFIKNSGNTAHLHTVPPAKTGFKDTESLWKTTIKIVTCSTTWSISFSPEFFLKDSTRIIKLLIRHIVSAFRVNIVRVLPPHHPDSFNTQQTQWIYVH